jgi:hypothetical protein
MTRPSAPPSSERTGPRAALAKIDVNVDSVPAGAQVLLAGQVLGKTPYRGALSRREGNITLVIRLAGHVDRNLVVGADRTINQRVTLVKSRDRDLSVNPFQ